MTEKKNPEDKEKVGAKTKYKKEYNEQAAKLCGLGSIDEDLADFFDVSVTTINRWKVEYPEFSVSIKEAKEKLDSKVVRSLFERATGYSHTAIQFATNAGKITDMKEYQKHYAPETAALIFWLKNRQPEQWRDKQEIEHSGSVAMTRLAEGRERANNRNKPVD